MGRLPVPADEPLIGAAADYLRLTGPTPEAGAIPTGEPWETIAAAHRLWTGHPSLRGLTEAFILAGLSDDEVSIRTGLADGTVGMFEVLCYNVRDRLSASDWVVLKAGLRRPGGPAPDPVSLLKSLAFFGGPVILDAALPYLLPGVGERAADPAVDAAIRRSIGLELLPDDSAADRKLIRLHVDEMERNKKSGRSDPSSGLWGHVLDSLLSVPEAYFDGDQSHAGSPGTFGELGGRPGSGATAGDVAQARATTHVLGEARRAEVLLPLDAGGEDDPKAVPGVRPTRGDRG